MFQDLNETLKKLLTEKITITTTGTVEISFKVPDDTFVKQINQLTINLFLYDIRENTELRSNDWVVERQINSGNRTAKKYFPLVKVDCSYLITIWSAQSSNSDTDGEIKKYYMYLGEVVKVLLGYPTIPKECLHGYFKKADASLRTSALHPPQSQNWSEFWQAMGGKPRTILNYTVTIPVEVNDPIEMGKIVQESIVNYMLENKDNGSEGTDKK